MKLVRFRIQNYKSIQDSGHCWLASDLTVLAGKNESGKSAILEALRDFDRSTPVSSKALAIDRPGKTPLIECHFELGLAELNDLLAPYSAVLREGLLNHLVEEGLTVFRNHEGQYSFDDTVSEIIEQIDSAEAQAAAVAEKERAEQLAQDAAKVMAEEAAGELDEGDDEDEVEEESETSIESDEAKPLLEAVIDRLPHFVFFSSFEDVLPFQTTFRAATNNRSVQDFAKVAGLDLAEVAGIQDLQERKNLLSAHAATISGDFKGYWRQDDITLSASPEGQNLLIGVQERGSTYIFKVEQRSKGLQWFLSFYLRLHAQGSGHRVILIDEPGLYLHATAQQDVLDVLEKSIAQEAQVVFSTHSPYLIDPDRFDRLRLIIKDQDSGTVIQGKVHAGADRETMTPIITAIGLSISHEFSVAGRKNVLVEGITDYFYLQAMRRLVPGNLLDGVTFIPCVGAPKVPQIASLLIGWGLGFVALLDRDAAGKRAAKMLKEQLLLPEDRVIYPRTQEGTAIEDLFTTGDFGKYVLRRPSAKDVSNSKAAKSEALDGALLARQFFQRAVGEPERLALTATTIAKFEKLFMVITAGLESEA